MLIEHLDGEVLELGEDEAQGRKLVRTLERSRRAARRRLLAALDSPRYFALLDALERPFATVADEPSLDEIHAAEHKRLRKAVGALAADSPDEELHAARIRVKRARYAAELQGDESYVQAAKRLQDILGEHQDAVVAIGEAARPGGPDARRRRRGRPADRARAATGAPQPQRVESFVEAAGEDGVIRASGGLIVRDGRVVVVHRPKYDDWSFPKGKAEAGESDEDCALREIEEETGLRVTLGDELQTTTHLDAQGRPKRIRWWRMTPLGGEFAATA